MSDLKRILNSLKIYADVVKVEQNEYISNYFLQLNAGTKVDKIEKNTTEIALGMRSYGKPIIKTIFSDGLISLEFVKKPFSSVLFEEFENELSQHPASLPLIVGKTYNNKNIIEDLALMPHLLVAGTTGSGKSVFLHSVICGLLSSGRNIKLALIDPKIVEFSAYKNVKNLMFPIAHTIKDAYNIVYGLIEEMDKRFALMAKKRVNNIEEYNKKNNMPYIVCIIDEFADLIMSGKKDLQKNICLLAQKSRACGIHLIISTQRPSMKVVDGVIKANFPSRISFKTASSIDSRIILDQNGAEKLNGKGEGLIYSNNYNIIRFQSPNITFDEIKQICEENKKTIGISFIEGIKKWI